MHRFGLPNGASALFSRLYIDWILQQILLSNCIKKTIIIGTLIAISLLILNKKYEFYLCKKWS